MTDLLLFTLSRRTRVIRGDERAIAFLNEQLSAELTAVNDCSRCGSGRRLREMFEADTAIQADANGLVDVARL